MMAAGKGKSLQQLSLLELAKEIAETGDSSALKEFHDRRTIFKFGKKGDNLLFAEYVRKLMEVTAGFTWPGRDYTQIAEMAYDLTIYKFCHLPAKKVSNVPDNTDPDRTVSLKGPDCQNHFRGYLVKTRKDFKDNPPSNPLEEEARAAALMQSHVNTHFYLARLEAERQANPFWSRYDWKLSGHNLTVWLPKYVSGRARGLWLETHVDSPDPLRPEERERVQGIIDRHFIKEFTRKIDERTHIPDQPDITVGFAGNRIADTLAPTVAEEKVGHIENQRRAIRALGPEKLEQLILRVFNNMKDDVGEDSRIAREFGLSKATFSRFAGSRWYESQGQTPDLWRNTAHLLASDESFKQTAIECGVWSKVEAVLLENAPVAPKGTTDE